MGTSRAGGRGEAKLETLLARVDRAVARNRQEQFAASRTRPRRARRFRCRVRSEEHTSELQSHHELVCRPRLEKKKRVFWWSSAGDRVPVVSGYALIIFPSTGSAASSPNRSCCAPAPSAHPRASRCSCSAVAAC